LTTVGLRLRRELPDLFHAGEYVALTTESSVRADIVAFARVHAQAAVLFVAPRLCAPIDHQDRVLPLGGDAWKTSRVLLPPTLAQRTFYHELSGAEIRPTISDTNAWIFAGQIFEHVPVGILRAL
jgi:maltooligosyltrehalose synthase